MTAGAAAIPRRPLQAGVQLAAGGCLSVSAAECCVLLGQLGKAEGFLGHERGLLVLLCSWSVGTIAVYNIVQPRPQSPTPSSRGARSKQPFRVQQRPQHEAGISDRIALLALENDESRMGTQTQQTLPAGFGTPPAKPEAADQE